MAAAFADFAPCAAQPSETASFSDRRALRLSYRFEFTVSETRYDRRMARLQLANTVGSGVAVAILTIFSVSMGEPSLLIAFPRMTPYIGIWRERCHRLGTRPGFLATLPHDAVAFANERKIVWGGIITQQLHETVASALRMGSGGAGRVRGARNEDGSGWSGGLRWCSGFVHGRFYEGGE